jgi:hypothetical protein
MKKVRKEWNKERFKRNKQTNERRGKEIKRGAALEL